MDIQTVGETPEEYVELEDGSVEIAVDDAPPPAELDFGANLVELLPKGVAQGIATEYAELVEKDKESRKKRDKQYEEGLRRTGLGDDAPGGAEFEGASKVVHPVLAEACVDFSSRAIKELFPPQGPVKTYIPGATTPDVLDRADRKMKFMNWQLTEQISEYRAELEQLLIQLPMGGSQYQKFWYDDRAGRPKCEFVPVDHVFLPYAATDFYTSARVTHRQLITRAELKQRVSSGLYVDAFADSTGAMPEQSLTGVANDKIEGREEDGYDEDGLRPVLEIYCWLELQDDQATQGEYAPYILTIDEDTEQPLALYRNWAEGDPRLTKLDWFVEWRFIPWRGAYAIGLPHLIGGLAAGLTGSLRALLDSAHINNAPTMLKLSSGRVSGQSKQVDITQVSDIEGPAGVDDVRKLAMPMPFNAPSPVLVELMDRLYTLAKGVVASADDAIGQVGDRTPVGTTMAIIEQGSPTYSAIHGRLHESQKRALGILHRINAAYMDDAPTQAGGTGASVSRQDFLSVMDIIPVSDPAIFSEAQRFAQVQALVQMSADPAVPWNKVNIYRRVLKQMRIDEVDDILPGQPKPVTADPLTENFAVIQQNSPLKVGTDQDHMSHIQAHLAYVSSPLLLNNPLIPPPAVEAIFAHINGHIMYALAQAISNTAQQAMQRFQGQISIDQAIAWAMQQIVPNFNKQFVPILQQIGQMQQALKQRTPPPELPPELQAQMRMAEMETQRKAAADQATLQFKQKAQQFDQMLEQQAAALEAQNMQFEQRLAAYAAQMDSAHDRMMQQVELQKNDADNRQKQMTELMKNHEDNQTNVMVEQMRQMGAEQREEMQQVYKAQQDKIDQVVNMALEMQRLEQERVKNSDSNATARFEAILAAAEKAQGDDALKTMVQGLQQTIKELGRPKKLTKDANGNITGVE